MADDLFSQLLQALGEDQPGLLGLLNDARLTVDADAATLHYTADYALTARMLERGDKLAAVAAALSRLAGRELSVRLEVAPAPEAEHESAGTVPPPPGSHRRVPPEQRGPDPELAPAPPGPHDVADDPLVRVLLEEFKGTVVKVE